MPAMMTQDPGDAARCIAAGHLAVIPTETVYGLGALANNAHAVSRIFATKGRPIDHPLIAHILDAQAAQGWADAIPEYAHPLMDAFWPGPLTLVFARSNRAADFITGGQNTVALRVPGSPGAREVLAIVSEVTNNASVAIAAPSANRFGGVSPTTAQHAMEEIGDLLTDDDVVLDAGPCAIGIESTIVDCTADRPRILRLGKVTAEDVEHATGMQLGGSSQVRAPGMLAAHYSPRASVLLVEEAELPKQAMPWGAGVIAPSGLPTPPGLVRLSEPATTEEYAADLYRALREADSLQLSTVVVVPPSGAGLADAVRDRITRAAHA